MLVLQNLAKMYRTHAVEVKALDGVSLQIEKGEYVAVCGPSGSGKTTLLMMIAAMLRPSGGTVRFEDRDVYEMTGPARARFRAEKIGFVFQMFHLVPYLNVLENVLLAAAVVRRRDGKAQAEGLLQRLGLQHRLGHRPSELSAGEKQRTAIARALLNQPKLILADEPTGNLDPENARCVLRHLRDFQREGGTVIVATHGPAAQEFATRTINLREGRLVNHCG
jgi:ABC-type lipoprotein export system ATPase subunit